MRFGKIEDAIVSVAALGIMILPLSEVVLRRFFNTGVPGAAPFTSHLTLVVGLMGAAIARAKASCSRSDGTDAAGRASEKSPESRHVRCALVDHPRLSDASRGSAYPRRGDCLGVTIWVADLAFPIAFGLIAARLVWKCSPAMTGRTLAALGIAAGAWISTHPELLLDQSPWPWILVLIGAAILGMPIYALIGGAAVILFLVQGDSPANAIIGSYDQLTSTDLPAIPLFTLAGFLLAEGRASERLLRLFRAYFGWAPGGTAIVAAILCAFFTLLTGGSGVTILALGGMLLPALSKMVQREISLGLLKAAGRSASCFRRRSPGFSTACR